MKLFYVLLALVSSVAFGGDDVRDMLFFPEEGAIWGQTSYEVSSSSYDLLTSEVESDSNSISQILYYVPVDKLAISVSLAKSETTTDAAGDKYESEGIENPAFGLVYELRRQEDAGHTVQIGASYSPSYYDAEEATTEEDGNVAAGRTQTQLFVRLGKKNDDKEHMFTGRFQSFGKYEQEDAVGSGKTTGESTTAASLEYRFQKNVNYNFSYKLGGGILLFQNEKYEDSDETERFYEGYNQLFWEAGLKYAVSPDLVFGADYTYNMPTTVDIEVDGQPYELENVQGFALEVYAAYAF